MTTIFERCVDFVIELEGGFTAHSLDRGGPTNLGITQRTLGAFRNVVVPSDDDVKNLTREEAVKIYAALFWNPARLERVQNSDTALILFAFAVHSGPANAVKLLQKSLHFDFGESILVDGDFGNKTFEALSKIAPEKLNHKLLRSTILNYVRVCEKSPSQVVFLEGWINRAFAIEDATKTV